MGKIKTYCGFELVDIVLRAGVPEFQLIVVGFELNNSASSELPLDLRNRHVGHILSHLPD